MMLTLETNPQLETVLCAVAARAGIAPHRYVLNLLTQCLAVDPAPPALVPGEEAVLLEKINEGLPLETWHRYHALIVAREAATLTPAEREELVALSNILEAWNRRRLECVAELARRREVPFPELVRQLGLVPPAND